MDSTFLRFFTRVDHLPPQDPWAAGQQMQYYYVGIAFFSSLLKLTGIDPAIGYNLAIATLGGLIACSVVSIAMAVTRSKVWSALSAVLVVCVSNLESIRVWIAETEHPYNFDSFWKTARVFTSPAFGEYTFWSLIFADFHAHVIAIPFTALLLGLLGTLWLQGGDRFGWSGIGARLGIGFLLGFLYAGNTWDMISYGAIAGLLVLLSPARKFWQPPTDSAGRIPIGERALAYIVSKGSALAWDGILIGGAAVSVMLPFAMQSASSRPIGWGWVQSFELNSLKQVLLFAGHWILVIVISAACIILSSCRRLLSVKVLCTSLLLALIPFFLGIMATWNGIEALPWGIITVAALLIWLGVVLAFVDPEDGWIGILVAGVGLTLVTAELLFLLDRMNTIFKSYMCVTLVSAISAVVLWKRAAALIRRSGVFQDFALEMRIGLHSANFICVALPLLGSVLNAKGIVSMQRVPERVYSLDGLAYYQRVNGEEYGLINWMNRNIKGTPVTLEAQGDSYQDYTRIAMHTGLPTVLGWDHHVGQRGTPGASVEQRRRDVRTIYSTPEAETAQKLLIEYNVDLIVVGKIERRTYPALALEKFDQFPEMFPVLYKDGSTTLYATQHSVFNPRRGSRARSIIER